MTEAAKPRHLGRRWLVRILAVVGLLVVVRGAFFAMGSKPQNLGVVGGKLRACPSSPNCVCTQGKSESHSMPPLKFADAPDAAWSRLKKVINDFPRTTIVTDDGHYMHVEFRTALIRFVDDVEFLMDADTGEIQFRSASRVGYSDFGTNRKRMSQIAAAFEQK